MAIRLAPAALAAVTIGCICGGARADSPAAVRKTLDQVYKRRDTAAEKKDVKGALSSLAPDFVFVSKDGQKGDVKLLKRRLTPLFALMQNVKSKSEIQKLTLKGNAATATVRQHLEMLILNQQTQQPQRFVADATSDDLWTKTGAGWLQKRMTTTRETAMLDGKSVDQQLNLHNDTGHPTPPARRHSAKRNG
jgi:hypothetical protein